MESTSTESMSIPSSRALASMASIEIARAIFSYMHLRCSARDSWETPAERGGEEDAYDGERRRRRCGGARVLDLGECIPESYWGVAQLDWVVLDYPKGRNCGMGSLRSCRLSLLGL